MMKQLAYFWVVFSALLIASCDNEIDVNAPFEETTVLYSTLDAGDNSHYIRVTRAYLGDEGIYGGNNSADSLYYDSLTVELKEINANGSVTRTFTAVRDNSVELDSGFFTAEGYTVFRVDAALDEDMEYRVVITRPDSQVVRAQTVMVKDFRITEPRFATFNPGGPFGADVSWEEALDGLVYRTTIDFHYVEFPRNNSADSIRGVVSYRLPYVTGSGLSGTGVITSTINRDQFYGNIAAQLDPPAGNRVRLSRGVDVRVEAGGDDLATHINVSQPQNGVLQDPPFFTNVEGGVGILSSIRVQNENNKRLSNVSLDELVYGSYTCGLKFGKVTGQGLDTLYCQP